jgi:adenylate cyclase
LRATTWRFVRILVAVTIASTAFGIAISPHTRLGVITGALNGAMGFVIASFEILLQVRFSAQMRRLPFGVAFALRIAGYVAIFLAANLADRAIAHLWFPGERLGSILSLPGTFGLIVAYTLVMNLFFMFSGLLGMPVLVSLLMGRYHQPREEQRIVLFLDLIGSTRLAETIGDRAFHQFLSQVSLDITNSVLETGGEIYRYVGDEIIVTWPPRRGIRNAGCISCILGIEDALTRRAPSYRKQFGAEPQLRAALHAGPLIVGEMGGLKREIVMLGDTMNTTARIEDVCRKMGRSAIVSGAVLERLGGLPSNVRAESLGTVALRGKESGLELFGLSRA